MNKNIADLKTSEEKKILFSRIEKRVGLISEKTKDYFEKSMSVSSDKIKNAFSNNEDLISILEQNNSLMNEIGRKSYAVKERNKTNFTKEIKLEVSQEIDNISLIQNTLDYKDRLINADDKMNALTKKESYINNRNKKRKEEMEESILNLELKSNDSDLLDIKAIKEDVFLIKNYIDDKEIKKTKLLYLLPIITTLVSVFLLILFIGGLLWT